MAPVNFASLRAITDGDKAVEAELFRLFLESSDACMEKLRAACVGGDNDTWRAEAHAFKGLSFNLGAESLGALCQIAQHDCDASPGEKEKMLAALECELAAVREEIDSQE